MAAGTHGTNNTTALTPAFGDTFSVPGFATNATGHVTSASAHTVKIPNSAATTSAAGLMSANDKTKLNQTVEFKAGTSYSFSGEYAGHISNSSASIVFFIPIIVSNVSNLFGTYYQQLTDLPNLSTSCICRGVKGLVYYDFGSTSSPQRSYELHTAGNAKWIHFSMGNRNTLGLMCKLDPMTSGTKYIDSDGNTYPNNTPVNVQITISLTC